MPSLGDLEISQRDLDSFSRDGFLVKHRVLDDLTLNHLYDRLSALFEGVFETGIRPDEVNWLEGESDPTLTRQICNGWKADRSVAALVMAAPIGGAIAALAGWSGTRVIQDNVIWKPPGARPLGMHRDNAYLAWYSPQEMLSCWMPLDDTSISGGTLELVRGSHRWPPAQQPTGDFHAPDDYLESMRKAAREAGCEVELVPVVVERGTAVFHHGWTWHGSGPNSTRSDRRTIVVHGGPAAARYSPASFGQGNGPVYARYRRLTDDQMDENHFPVSWREDGYRTPGLDQYLNSRAGDSPELRDTNRPHGVVDPSEGR